MQLTTVLVSYAYMCVSTFRFWSRVADSQVTWMKHVPPKRTTIRYFVVYYNQQEQYGENVNFWGETDFGVSYFRPTKNVWLVIGFQKNWIFNKVA
jgi:archaellum component FlaF (FlaF/FlaG flagellin family)